MEKLILVTKSDCSCRLTKKLRCGFRNRSIGLLDPNGVFLEKVGGRTRLDRSNTDTNFVYLEKVSLPANRKHKDAFNDLRDKCEACGSREHTDTYHYARTDYWLYNPNLRGVAQAILRYFFF